MNRATITLDVCTPEGRTWLAEVTGVDRKYGLERVFVTAADRRLSKSGKTGSIDYTVGPGLYESNEGRRRFGRRFWRVDTDGTVHQIERGDVLDIIDGNTEIAQGRK
jgi:hypothetical protein